MGYITLVTTQRILNKFIEIHFSVGCMVWPWCCLLTLFQPELPVKILMRYSHFCRNLFLSSTTFVSYPNHLCLIMKVQPEIQNLNQLFWACFLCWENSFRALVYWGQLVHKKSLCILDNISNNIGVMNISLFYGG